MVNAAFSEKVGRGSSPMQVTDVSGATGVCPRCSSFSFCKPREFSNKAWHALRVWHEVEEKLEKQPICSDCYIELREILIDRADEVEIAFTMKPEPLPVIKIVKRPVIEEEEEPVIVAVKVSPKKAPAQPMPAKPVAPTAKSKSLLTKVTDRVKNVMTSKSKIETKAKAPAAKAKIVIKEKSKPVPKAVAKKAAKKPLPVAKKKKTAVKTAVKAKTQAKKKLAKAPSKSAGKKTAKKVAKKKK